MAITLSQEQLDAVKDVEEAVKNQDREAFRGAAKHLKTLTADISCEQSKNAIRVLAVMGMVGDIENAPAVFAYLKERIKE